MITVQIIINNNEETIEKTLKSIEPLNAKILIANLGCSDKTVDICKNFNNIEIINFYENDRSKIRNKLSKEINFYLEPWESIVAGHDEILDTKQACSVQVFNNDIITKETRLWTSEKFKNPVFESIEKEHNNYNSKIILSCKNEKDNRKENLVSSEQWMKANPTLSDPYYYLACCHLSLRDYKKFIIYSDQYLIREKNINVSYIMTKYYLSQIHLHNGEIKAAAENALTCVSYFPFMAEFWCLLGDIYYKQKQFKKSKSLYENAIIIGKKRKLSDKFPIEIKKYKEYPKNMISNIKEIIKNTKIY
jgi:hypothetical protein